MDKQQKILLIILSVLLIAVLVTTVVVALRKDSFVIENFVPPPFDDNAVSGTPDVSNKGFGTMTVRPDFVIGLCPYPEMNESCLELYFTSPETNSVWMRICIYDESGVLLAESGLIKPGEYLPSVSLPSLPTSTKKLYARIFSYEPNTYYSEGAVDVTLEVRWK